jgi:hypothetical protein
MSLQKDMQILEAVNDLQSSGPSRQPQEISEMDRLSGNST